MVKVMNLVTRRPGGTAALGGRSSTGRNLFLVPWHGRALFGTWESGRVSMANDYRIVESDVAAFITELNEAFPSFALGMDDVTLIHRGVVPAVAANGQVSLEGHEQIREHGPDGLEGLLSVVGAKYTTARRVAERITDRMFTKLGQPAVLCHTGTSPLPGGAIRDLAATLAATRRRAPASMPDATVAHLVAAYGTRSQDILALCVERPDLCDPLAEGEPVIGAELVWAARHEMVVTLADAVIRRTPLGALGDPGDAALERAAALVGGELGWAGARQAEEIAATKRFYAWKTPA
jgi:glycerol-3-phosphate dehydrogenase